MPKQFDQSLERKLRDEMNRMLYRVLFLLLSGLLSTACLEERLHLEQSDEEVEVKLVLASMPQVQVETRTTQEDLLEDVHLLFFENRADAEAKLIQHRVYSTYGAMQRVRLKVGTYKVVAFANITNNPNYKMHALQTDEQFTLAELRAMQIELKNPTATHDGAMAMISEVQSLVITKESSANAFVVPMKRIASKVKLNIWVKDDSNVSVESWQARNIATSSFTMSKTAIATDPLTYPNSTWITDNGLASIVATRTLFSPDTTHPAKEGYALYQTEFFLLENHHGYANGVTTASERNNTALRPLHASLISLTAFNTQQGNQSKLIYTIHLGNIDSNTGGRINNYDVLRNSIYHMNVTINSATNVEVDTRVHSLNELITTTIPFLDKLDGHYVTRPVYYAGLKGVAKVELGYYATANTPTTFKPVGSEADKQWCQLNRDQRSMTLDFNKNVDAVTGATVNFYCDENLQHQQTRTLVLRTTHHPDARTEDMGAIEADRYEDTAIPVIIDKEIVQQGVTFIGNMGSWDSEKGYYSGLVVEHFEEYLYTPIYFPVNNPEPNLVTGLPFWGAAAFTHTTAIGDISATYTANTSVYNAGLATNAGLSGTYNERYNTYATRYCMSKNRDLAANTNIAATAIKEGWYLPSAQQLAILFALNPLLQEHKLPQTDQGYWSCFSQSATKAYAVSYSMGYEYEVDLRSTLKIRCVREVEANSFSGNWIFNDPISIYPIHVHLQRGGFENVVDRVKDPIELNGQVSRDFSVNDMLSAHFVIASADIYGSVNGNPAGCSGYKEGQYSSGWRLPTLRELQLIYSLNSTLVALMPPIGSSYVGFMPVSFSSRTMSDGTLLNRTYACINAGRSNSSNYTTINFSTQVVSSAAKNNSNYIRCVRDLSATISLTND